MARGRKPLTKSTTKNAWRAKFLKELADCGCVLYAARKAGIDKVTAYNHRNKDAAFAAAWDEAIEASRDVMEREARRRAIDGVLKPVFQGGLHVGDVQEYSDTLLIFLMKGAHPEKYRERASFEHSGPNGKPIQFQAHEYSDAEIEARIADLAKRAIADGVGTTGGDGSTEGA